jgi:hypothetical protein
MVPRRQDSRLLFSDAWFIVAKSWLIFLQILFYLIHHFMSSIGSFFEKLLLMIKLLSRISNT